jgi:hypothetical protein
MKSIHITLEDSEYMKALARKGKRTWKEVFMANLEIEDGDEHR